MEKPNIDYILKLSRGDEMIRQKFIDTIKYELPLEIDAYFVSLHIKKMTQTSECIHKLKHKMAILGLEKSYYVAEDYEKEILNNELTQQPAFEKTLKLMQNFINTF